MHMFFLSAAGRADNTDDLSENRVVCLNYLDCREETCAFIRQQVSEGRWRSAHSLAAVTESSSRTIFPFFTPPN